VKQVWQDGDVATTRNDGAVGVSEILVDTTRIERHGWIQAERFLDDRLKVCHFPRVVAMIRQTQSG
jgi:hypothetical protein